ncbi:MAG: hypothetical protein JXB26_01955 [Candidatus Aminicenantes bacterium]|nr:hypothetical protein [Candidatus Aminicenantes bacterium]
MKASLREVVQQLELSEKTKNWREGMLEIEVHYGQWTVDWVKSLFEGKLADELGGEIRKEMIRTVRKSHPSIVDTEHEDGLAFDSGGMNYGLEVRFYPKGREGAFSLGLSLERTEMRFTVSGTTKQIFSNATYAEVEAEAFVKISPISSNLSFRWDFKPSWRVTPYFVFGLGIAGFDGTMGYSYEGSYIWSGPEESIEDNDEKNIQDFEEEIEFNLPNIIPFLQLHLGIRGEILPFLHVRVEAGIWDGFVVRGGLAYRF